MSKKVKTKVPYPEKPKEETTPLEDRVSQTPQQRFTTRSLGLPSHTMTRKEYYERTENRESHLDYVGHTRHDKRIKAAP